MALDKIKSLFAPHASSGAGALETERVAAYDALSPTDEHTPLRIPRFRNTTTDEDDDDYYDDGRTGDPPFSWFEYTIFVLLGVAMLWAWNMFLAAAPYFQTRLAASPTLVTVFQPLILAVSTLTSLSVMLLLQNMQATASYPFRITMALALSTATFTLLTLSTWLLSGIPPAAYLVFVLGAVAASASASGMIQNGAFAFAAGFGRGEYMQALMVGQAIAGVVPPVTEVLSVLLVPGGTEGGVDASDSSTVDASGHGMSSTAAFVYFLTAVLVSSATLLAFGPLARRHPSSSSTPPLSPPSTSERMRRSSIASLEHIESAETAVHRSSIPLSHLFSRLHWHACALFASFALTMFYPVLTTRILSIHYPSSSSPSSSEIPPILQPAAFIPLAFLFWNLGDLLGRIAAALPVFARFRRHPRLLLAASLARVAFLPLYGLCNLDGAGATVASDVFYLLVVQGGFGLTNGCVGSACMMAAAEWVDEDEREAAGGFVVLCMVAGLAAGSLLSFLAAALF